MKEHEHQDFRFDYEETMTKTQRPFLSGRTFNLHRLLVFAVVLVFALAVWPSGRIEVGAAKSNQSATGESRFTTLDGARIHYVNYGKGSEALVLIHGWTMNLDSWHDQVSDFA